MKFDTEKPLPEVFFYGRSQDISNRGYLPDCHVDLHAMPSYIHAIQLKPDTYGFTRTKT